MASDLCSPTFADLAARLGFSCAEAGGMVEFRSPTALENWTLPVLEYTIIAGSILALVLAIVRLRRGDATNIALWFGACAFLFVIEPPLYFPAAFRIEEHVDTMFAHNVFTVDFMWGRLPLYIVAIYPLMATMAFELIRMLGVFRRYGAFVGAACVGFVHHAFYEIFDQLGPQLRWWEWSLDNPINQPFFDAVPFPSVVVFAALWPMSLAFCTQFFVGRHVDDGRVFPGLAVVWRTVVIGLTASLGVFILPIPATILGIGSDTRRGVIYGAELVILSVVAIYVIYRQWARLRAEGAETTGGAPAPVHRNDAIRYFAIFYLAVMAVLWATALPDYFGATGGVTANGDPIGNLWYTLACFAVGILVIAATYTAPQADPRPAADARESVPAA